MALNIMSQSNNRVPPGKVLTSATRHRRFAWLSALGLCGLCSCTSLSGQRAQDPFQSEPQPSATSATQPDVKPAAGRARLASIPDAPVPQLAQRPVRPRLVAPTYIQLTSNQSAPVSRSDNAVERVAAESRTPGLNGDAYAAGPVVGDDASPRDYPDEYLFDGGDRDYPITRNLDDYRGLDTEDTIAQYEDEQGAKKIKKTNRVAIYAPRFGSIVTVTGPNSETLVDKVHGHVVAQGGINLRTRTSATSQDQKLPTGRMDTHLRANGIGTEISTDTFNRGQGRAVEVAVMNTHESLNRQRTGQFEDRLRPHQLEGMQFAELWTRKQNPIIQGHASSASQSVVVQGQAELVGLEDKGKRGVLRLHKVADKGAAAIGDVITFTIHYENAGDREIKNVVLIDNLTPRLEYIAEATTTDRPGKVETEDNQEGSVILRFVLEEALPGHTKGSITFQARVR